MIKTKHWVLLLLLIAALCTAVLLLQPGSGTTAEILLDGEVIRRIDLDRVSAPQTFVVETDWGRNTILIEPGRIRVLEADCPDGICVRRGWLPEDPSPIVCIPHHLVIRLTDGTGPDTLSQ